MKKLKSFLIMLFDVAALCLIAFAITYLFNDIFCSVMDASEHLKTNEIQVIYPDSIGIRTLIEYE